jgi:hypothetical protein
MRIELNLPEFSPQLKKQNSELLIFDPIRKKYLVLTPEEWVRQQIVNQLINKYNYPKSLFRLESGLKYDKKQKRSDILVYDRSGKPFLLIECKAMEIQLDEKVLTQAAQYNFILQAPYVAITNGIHLIAYCIDYQANTFEFLQEIPQLP